MLGGRCAPPWGLQGGNFTSAKPEDRTAKHYSYYPSSSRDFVKRFLDSYFNSFRCFLVECYRKKMQGTENTIFILKYIPYNVDLLYWNVIFVDTHICDIFCWINLESRMCKN